MSLINEELIKILKRNTPPKENTVNILMDLIPIGKEAAYRRLRGEIPFTLDEAITICKEFNISLDLLIGTGQKNIYAFHLNAMLSEEPMSEYKKMMSDIKQGVEYIENNDPNGFSYRAYRSIPHEFIYKYKSLSKVYLYILFYQLHSNSKPNKLSEIIIPEDIFSLQKEVSKAMHNIDSILILDKRIVIDFIEIINYFLGLGMILEDEIAEIKKDLHSLINDLERCTITGKSLFEKKMDIYISNISFDCTYTYIEGINYIACSVGVYCIDHITCLTQSVCESHKRWIKSLVRFSTLISVSGELQRNQFFNQQREYIDSML